MLPSSSDPEAARVSLHPIPEHEHEPLIPEHIYIQAARQASQHSLQPKIIEAKKEAADRQGISLLKRSSQSRILIEGDKALGEKATTSTSVQQLLPLPFVYTLESSGGLSNEEGDARLLLFGRNELPEVKIPPWFLFIQQLWQPMPLLIWLAIGLYLQPHSHILRVIFEHYICCSYFRYCHCSCGSMKSLKPRFLTS